MGLASKISSLVMFFFFFMNRMACDSQKSQPNSLFYSTLALGRGPRQARTALPGSENFI